MSWKYQLDEGEYRQILKDAWDVKIDVANCFPEQISNWILYNATLIGVPPTYIAWPLLVATSYCAQHSLINANDIHFEPTVIYGLVVGRSGTNKSASLRRVTSELEKVVNINPAGSHLFESGTMEGLMKTLSDNMATLMGVFDEFSTFHDNLDKGTTGASEKGRYLSLFSAVDWSKKTKTSGCMQIKDPRFNMISFTQPFYAAHFAKNSIHDGFFQRFLITVPGEVYVKMEDKENALKKFTEVLELSELFRIIYERCCDDSPTLKLSDEAFNHYKVAHDNIVDFRCNDVYEEERLSIKSKSLGHILRLSGTICLLRESLRVLNDEKYDLKLVVTDADFIMAQNIVNYSVQISFALIAKSKSLKSNVNLKTFRQAIPEPENMTIEFLMPYTKFLEKLCKEDKVPLSVITRDNIYPVINKEKGAEVAARFIKGLCKLGLGKITDDKPRSFKRFRPTDVDCPDKENIESKWRKLNLM